MMTKTAASALLLALLPLSAPHRQAVGALAYSAAPTAQQAPGLSDSAFAALSARVSEPGGYFDSDNLISNESSYLHVLGAMRRIGVSGGTYIGVGPDQNFSYIAQVRPKLAFIIDIRRDNLLQHLLFKSLFELARNRGVPIVLIRCHAPQSVLESRIAERSKRADDASEATLNVLDSQRASFEAIGDDEGLRVIDADTTRSSVAPEVLASLARVLT